MLKKEQDVISNLNGDKLSLLNKITILIKKIHEKENHLNYVATFAQVIECDLIKDENSSNDDEKEFDDLWMPTMLYMRKVSE